MYKQTLSFIKTGVTCWIEQIASICPSEHTPVSINQINTPHSRGESINMTLSCFILCLKQPTLSLYY